jgi:hypothetical protein
MRQKSLQYRRGKGAHAGCGKNHARNKGIVMYAVIKTGGKQYRVSPGEKLKVELLEADIVAFVNLAKFIEIW